MILNTYLIQIFLPLSDNDGNRFPQKHYADIQTMLVDRFGGLTAFMRAPATGFWADDKDKTVKDDIVIIEVQTDRLEAEWWHQYRQSLEALFSQDRILIRAQSTTIL